MTPTQFCSWLRGYLDGLFEDKDSTEPLFMEEEQIFRIEDHLNAALYPCDCQDPVPTTGSTEPTPTTGSTEPTPTTGSTEPVAVSGSLTQVIASAPFHVNLPELPRVDGMIPVVHIGQSETLWLGSGVHQLQGDFGDVILNGNDIEVFFDSGSSARQVTCWHGSNRHRIVGTPSASVNSVLIPGATTWVGDGPLTSIDHLVHDVTLENVRIATGNGLTNGLNIHGRRVLVKDCDINAEHYSIWASGPDFPIEDIVVHNTRMVSAGPEATARFVDARRVIVEDCYLSNTMKHVFRLHGVTDSALFKHNETHGTGIMHASMDGDQVSNVWHIENEVHCQGSSFTVNFTPERLTNFTSQNNTVYSDFSCHICDGPQPTWTVEGDQVLPYTP